MHHQQQWLGAVPWESVLNINQALCQAQKTTHQPNAKTYEKAHLLWDKAVPRMTSLSEALEVCRKCFELSPFTFNNGNTFAAIGKTLIEDGAKSLPPVEAQIVRTTVGHYIAGLIGKKEMVQVLRHFEETWKAPSAAPPASGSSPQPAPRQPQA